MVVSPNLVKRQKQHFNVLETLGMYVLPLQPLGIVGPCNPVL